MYFIRPSYGKLPKYGLLLNVLQVISFDVATTPQLSRICSSSTKRVVRYAISHGLIEVVKYGKTPELIRDKDVQFKLTNAGEQKLNDLVTYFEKKGVY